VEDMPGLVSNRVTRAVKAGGPPAAITAAIGIGATGVAGPNVESKTAPLASGFAETLGLSPESGPVLVLLAAVLVAAVALVAPGLFEERSH
jgi:hypothetical protein